MARCQALGASVFDGRDWNGQRGVSPERIAVFEWLEARFSTGEEFALAARYHLHRFRRYFLANHPAYPMPRYWNPCYGNPEDWVLPGYLDVPQ